MYSSGTRGNESLSPYEKRNYSRSGLEIAFREDLCTELKTKLCVIYGNWCSVAPRVLGDPFRASPHHSGPAFALAVICLIRELSLLNYLDNLQHNTVEDNANSLFNLSFLKFSLIFRSGNSQLDSLF